MLMVIFAAARGLIPSILQHFDFIKYFLDPLADGVVVQTSIEALRRL
jgi:hypothetical protein